MTQGMKIVMTQGMRIMMTQGMKIVMTQGMRGAILLQQQRHKKVICRYQESIIIMRVLNIVTVHEIIICESIINNIIAASKG